MTTDLQFAIHWLREWEQTAARAFCVRAGLDYSQADELLEPQRPAWLDQVAPVVPLSLVEQTALLRAVEATGWRAPLPELGPVLGLHTRSTIEGRHLRHLQRALGPEGAALNLATKLGINLLETLVEHGYLRLEMYPSDGRPDEYNLQLVFRPGLGADLGGYQGPPPWPMEPVKRKTGASDPA